MPPGGPDLNQGSERELPAAQPIKVSGSQIIAITGSVGKTSTKEALKLALSASGKTLRLVAA